MAYHYGLSLWPIIMVYHYGLSLWPIIMAYQYGLSLWPIIMAYHYGLSLWPIIMAYHYGLSLGLAKSIISNFQTIYVTNPRPFIKIHSYKFSSKALTINISTNNYLTSTKSCQQHLKISSKL